MPSHLRSAPQWIHLSSAISASNSKSVQQPPAVSSRWFNNFQHPDPHALIASGWRGQNMHLRCRSASQIYETGMSLSFKFQFNAHVRQANPVLLKRLLCLHPQCVQRVKIVRTLAPCINGKCLHAAHQVRQDRNRRWFRQNKRIRRSHFDKQGADRSGIRRIGNRSCTSILRVSSVEALIIKELDTMPFGRTTVRLSAVSIRVA